jgi:hypothetical protein
LAGDVARDLMTNPRTTGFARVNRQELEERLFNLLHHLGNWISDRRSENVQMEFADWGRRRFNQGIPISEIVFAIVILKQHLRRYVREHGLVEHRSHAWTATTCCRCTCTACRTSTRRSVCSSDEALYHLAVGYERVTAAATR